MILWTAACQASLSFTISLSLLKLMSIESVMPSKHLILCHPLLFLPSVFPSIMVFSSESALCIRLPKYWSFSLSISPSNEYSGLISFRIDWFDHLAVQETLKSLLQLHSSKHQFFGTQPSLWSNSYPYMTVGKTITLTIRRFAAKWCFCFLVLSLVLSRFVTNICWIIEKAREFQKNIYLCFINYTKAFYCVDHDQPWKALREMEIPDHLSYLMRNLYALSRSNS